MDLKSKRRSRALLAFGLGPKSRPVGRGGIRNVRVGFEALIFRPAMLRAQAVWPSHKFGSEASWEKKCTSKSYHIACPIDLCSCRFLESSPSGSTIRLYKFALQNGWACCAADVAPGSGLTHSSSSTFVSPMWRRQSNQAPTKNRPWYSI